MDRTKTCEAMEEKNHHRQNNSRNSRNTNTRRRYRPVPQAAKQTDASFSDHGKDNIPQHALQRGKQKRTSNVATKESCIICTNTLRNYAIGECNHVGICGTCFMRMRYVMNDQSCPICKQFLPKVVVTNVQRRYESFQRWNEDIIEPGMVSDAASNMIFVGCREHYDELLRLRELRCRVQSCVYVNHTFGSTEELIQHMKSEHNKLLCSLCISHQHFFIQEYPVYTKKKLAAHNVGQESNRLHDKKLTKERHPMCQFCKKRYYSENELYQHLEQDHFKCHLCPSDHQYYRNYFSLEKHFRSNHFLCDDQKCLRARFVVFGNEFEHQAHMVTNHNVRNPRLAINFHVTRASNARPNDISGPDTWTPLESERSQTDAIGSVNVLEEAFPALPRPSPASTNITSPLIPSVITRNRSPQRDTERVPDPNQGLIDRNRRLARALGLSRPGFHEDSDEAFALELVTPSYSDHLKEWGRNNARYLSIVERRLERLVKDPKCFSVFLRQMPAEERACMHELGAIYGVSSQSHNEEPRRRVMFVAREDAKIPRVTLSKHLAQKSNTNTYPLLGCNGLPSGPTHEGSRNGTSNRGWECIVPPVVHELSKDAWSDGTLDEEQTPSQAE